VKVTSKYGSVPVIFSTVASLAGMRLRLLRARRLYGYGQGLAAQGSEQALLRAARLYRRALRTLDPQIEPRELLVGREQLRDAVRTRLAQHGLIAWLVRSPRRALVVGAIVLVSLGVNAWPLLLARDLAEGKLWIASSAYGSFSRSGLMSGDPNPDGRFHTLEEPFPSLAIDLGSIQPVHAVAVDNRLNCCRERALPLVIEVSEDGSVWRRVAYRRALFSSFTARFVAVRARYVRLHVDRRSTFHLLRVSVY
jgi:hypothetical protein